MKKSPRKKGIPQGFGAWNFDTDWEFSNKDLLAWGVALGLILGTILLCSLGVI